MQTKSPVHGFKFPGRTSAARCAVLAVAATLAGPPAQAAFHLWTIREIYTDNTGSLQFIELFCSASGQTFVGGNQISVSNLGGTNAITHTFTVPSSLSSDSLNKTLLFGTSGLHAAGAPTPDYIIPNNFLFSGGGSISFFGQNSGTYTALPTDGVTSRNWGDGNAIASPQNFSGQIGTVPEPATWALLMAGGLGLGFLLHRRRQ